MNDSYSEKTVDTGGARRKHGMKQRIHFKSAGKIKGGPTL